MGLIGVEGDAAGIYYSKNGFLKISGLRTPYAGDTFLVAVCFSGGVSGAVEPLWSQLDNGFVFKEGSVSWRVSNIPVKPAYDHWNPGQTYGAGEFILARTLRVKTKGVKRFSSVSALQHHHKVPTSPFYTGEKHFNSVQSRQRRTFLKRIWTYVLSAGDRTDWNALAATELFDNFKGMHKAFSGWETFEYCNQGILPPQNTLGDGTVQFMTKDLPPYSTLTILLPKPFAV